MEEVSTISAILLMFAIMFGLVTAAFGVACFFSSESWVKIVAGISAGMCGMSGLAFSVLHAGQRT